MVNYVWHNWEEHCNIGVLRRGEFYVVYFHFFRWHQSVSLVEAVAAAVKDQVIHHLNLRVQTKVKKKLRINS